MMTYVKEIKYRKFKISHWRDQSKDIYRVVSASVPMYLTVYKLFSRRWHNMKDFTALEDAENWVDNLYIKAEEVDKLLSDVITSIQFIHTRNKPEIVHREITTKRELEESEVIELLEEEGYEKRDILELEIDTQYFAQPGTISAKRWD